VLLVLRGERKRFRLNYLSPFPYKVGAILAPFSYVTTVKICYQLKLESHS
jgi:hypothetical protein